MLPRFGETSRSNTNTRVRTGVTMLEPTVLPIHDGVGGGDVPRPPTSYTGRAIKARKAAQMEYKAQLDTQIAERKKAKELEKNQNVIMTTMTTGPICGTSPIRVPVQFQPSPSPEVTHYKNGVPGWLLASPPPATLLPEYPTPPAAMSLAVATEKSREVKPNITFSPFPIIPSKSLPACHQLPPSSESQHGQTVYRGNMADGTQAQDSASPTPAAISQSSPQLVTREHQIRTYVYSDSATADESMTNENAGTENVIHHAPHFSSTPIPIPHQTQRQIGPESIESHSQVGEETYGGDSSFLSASSLTDSGSFPHGTSILNFKFDESTGAVLASTLVHSPKLGTSPCGSYIGDSCSVAGSNGSFFGSPKTSFKPHVSQTADQRPEPSVLRINYKCELECQIRERKQLEEDRLRKEKEDEEKLQKKIQDDQERMRKEYEAEQLKLKHKEDEKRQRQEENVKRLKEVEEARLEALQKQRRERMKASATSTEPPVSQEPLVEFKPPASPPIPTITKQNKTQEYDLPREIEQPISLPEITSGTNTAAERIDRRRPGSGITDTLKFLEQVRGILNQEIAESQVRYQKEMEELNDLCSK